ncbi:MAG TPA: DoxX family protein [Oleiagrimonas sp.]|nr:DoxX family protein [Oleiagrimonas sp.]
MAGVATSWSKAAPILLSILRIVMGFLFMQHGGDKLLGFPAGDPIESGEIFTITPGLAGLLELVGGFLILIGLFTRPVAFVLSGEMAFAYFMAHFPANHAFPILNGGGMAVAFCFVFLYLSAAGAGPWSVDRGMGRR